MPPSFGKGSTPGKNCLSLCPILPAFFSCGSSCRSPKSKKQEAPPATVTTAGGVSLWVENKKEVKRRMVGKYQFYAAFAGAKTTAFFCRACMERTMQLRVKLMTK